MYSGPPQPGQQPPLPPQQPPTQYPPYQQPGYYPQQPQQPYGQPPHYPQYQQPQWQQPPQRFPQPPYQQPPPKKKKRIWLWIALVIIALIVIGSVGNHSSTQTTTSDAPTTTSSAPAPQVTTAQATHAPTTWTTIQTFSGNGTKKTATFTVPDSWKIIWSCTPSSFFGGSYNVIVSVNGTDGTPIDPAAVNTICKAGNTGDQTEEHQGGAVYLDVNSEGAWTIKVQVLK